MALKRKTLTELTLPLPEELDDTPGKGKMTWSAQAVSSGQERALGEIMLSFRWVSTASTWMVQAWLSYVDSSFLWDCADCKEPQRIFPKKDDITFAQFVEAWDSLPDDIREWILDKVVWTVNPHWRPFEWPVDEEEPEKAEKKAS